MINGGSTCKYSSVRDLRQKSGLRKYSRRDTNVHTSTNTYVYHNDKAGKIFGSRIVSGKQFDSDKPQALAFLI